MEAIDACNRTSILNDVEYHGYVYVDQDGVIGYTSAPKSKSTDHAPAAPEGTTILVMWHTHGNGANAEYMSSTDNQHANAPYA